MSNQSPMQKMTIQWNFLNRKFSTSLVWHFATNSEEKHNSFLSANERVFMSLTCREKEKKLSTMTLQLHGLNVLNKKQLLLTSEISPQEAITLFGAPNLSNRILT